MAHKGRLYPLAFRRDLSINVNNYSLGFAHAYTITLQVNFFANLSCLDGLVLGSVEQPMPNLLTMEWLGAYQPACGDLWRIRLRQQFVNLAPATLAKLGFLERFPGDVVSAWHWNEPDKDATFRFNTNAGTDYWDPSVFASDPTLWASSIEPVGY